MAGSIQETRKGESLSDRHLIFSPTTSLDSADGFPATRTVIRLGVTGHRPNRLAPNQMELLERRCSELFALIRDLVAQTNGGAGASSGIPGIRIVSPLAEGADRILAKAGLRAGMDLQCPLPYPRDDYANDFADATSQMEFRELLSAASSVIELDGTRADEPHAYEELGRIVVANSDVLIAIWNGESAAGAGGTAAVVSDAVAAGIPVIWLKPDAAEPAVIVADALGRPKESSIEGLERHIASILRDSPLPSQKERKRTPRRIWSMVTAVLDSAAENSSRERETARVLASVSNTVFKTIRSWETEFAREPEFSATLSSYVLKGLAPHFAWADALALHYGQKYRWSVRLSYFAGAFAVFFAVAGLLDDVFKQIYGDPPKYLAEIWIAIELTLIVIVLAITAVGNYFGWHRRWLNYRMLAEELRSVRFLCMLGDSLPSPHVAAHLAFAHSGDNWPTWHAQKVVRELGLAPVKLDSVYLAAVTRWLIEVEVTGQLSYHTDTATRFRKNDRVLHVAGMLLFIASLPVCLLHFFAGDDWQKTAILFAAAVLPAFGGALFGVRNHGEHLRLAHRSHAMAGAYSAIRGQLIGLPKPVRSEMLRTVGRKILNVMREETVDWRAVLHDRPLGLPL